MQDLLTTALKLHQAGQMEPAAQLYQQIIEREPKNADALHLLGVLRHQQGDHPAAVEWIGKAIALKPTIAAYHGNLAEVYRALGQLERSVECSRTSLRLSPNDAEAHCNLGLAMLALNRHADAAQEFRRALKLRPNFALAQRNLGVSLRELGRMHMDAGRAAEALPYCQEAVRWQPIQAMLHYNLGNVLLALGQTHEAKAAFFEATRLDPKMAEAFAGLGLAWHHEGQLGDALAWLKRAIEMKPDGAAIWEHLAELYLDREDFADSIACRRRALALNPSIAAAHSNLACALQGEGQSAEAEEHYQAALRLDPSLTAAHVGIAGLREERGDLAAAESALREAIRLHPTSPIPHGRLATLLRGRLPEADGVLLRERLADPQLASSSRASLLFGLAHVLDARGEFPEAAECLKLANALKLERWDGRKPKYDPAEHEDVVNRVIQGFGPAFFARTSGMGLPTRRPVFIFGLPRSGTTLIEQVLASHSQVYGAGELRLAKQSLFEIPSVLRRSYHHPLDCLGALDARAIQRLAHEHEARLTELAGAGAERIVDKMPDNYLFLGLLATLFPGARFIHCRRDLRDVAVSCWMTDFRGIRWSNDVEHIASRFQQYRRLMQHWRTVLPAPMLEVDYEETVADLDVVARRLIAWVGLPWEPACLRYHETQRSIRTASVAQVRQPIYTKSVGRWKNYERELAELFARLPVE